MFQDINDETLETLPRGKYLDKIKKEVDSIGAHVIAFEDLVRDRIDIGRNPLKKNPYTVVLKNCCNCGQLFEIVVYKSRGAVSPQSCCKCECT